MDKPAYPANEYGRLRRLVAEQKQDWRLHRRKAGRGFYALTDTANVVLAEKLTGDEVRKLCAVWRHWRRTAKAS
jgi:hypothetical protein